MAAQRFPRAARLLDKAQFDAVFAANDNLATQTINALESAGVGPIPLSGQDATAAGLQQIVLGKQTMTVYKPLDQLATQAAKLAVDLARGEKPAYNSHYDNGEKSVDSVLLQPVALTRDNVDKVITDGFYSHAQVYGN